MFLEKSRSVYKVCRYFIFLFVGKRASWYDAENWDRIKETRIISDTAVFSGKNGVSIET